MKLQLRGPIDKWGELDGGKYLERYEDGYYARALMSKDMRYASAQCWRTLPLRTREAAMLTLLMMKGRPTCE